MKRFFALTKAMFLIHIRERSSLFWNFGFPIFLLILYGAIFGGGDVTAFMTWMMPGVVSINILAFGLISSSTLMVEMRRKGVLRRLQGSPIPTLSLIGSYALVNVVIGLLQALLVILFAVFVYKVQISIQGIALALVMIAASVIMSVGLGQVVSGIVPSIGAAVAIGQILYFGQMFISDTIMPVTLLPAWVQKVSPWLPGYAIAQLVRPPLQSGVLSPDLLSNLLKTVLYLILGLTLAAITFRWEAHHE